MKIDAHQHFWIYNSSDYGWIGDNMDVLKRNYLPEDLCSELASAGFSGSVAVQARQTVEETRWLLELSGRYDFIKGVVGWADLSDEESLRRQLDEFCSHKKLVGLRHVIHDEPDDNFMLRDNFLRGISILKDYNLTFDLLIFPKHIPVAQLVVSMFPKQKFVLDHISKPPIRNKVISPWREDIIRLAQNKNVWCKLSGMVTEAELRNWKHEDFRPYLNVVFEAFGTERLMVGSDWPVCRLAGEYQEVTDIVERYLPGMQDDLRRKVTGENCISFYGLAI